MPGIIEGPPEPGEPQRPLRNRLLWFAALAVAGLAATSGVAYGLRALLLG
jgi:hypothetical protein